MRTKIVHGIDDNDNIYEWLLRNKNLPDTDQYKLSEDEFCGRWLALKPHCSEHEKPGIIGSNCGQDCKDSYENFQPCMNCLYYGEFETIDDSLSDVFERWEPPILECKKLCLNCISLTINEDQNCSVVSDDSSPDSIS